MIGSEQMVHNVFGESLVDTEGRDTKENDVESGLDKAKALFSV